MSTQRPQTTDLTRYRRIADQMQRQRRNRRLSIRKAAEMAHLPEGTIRELENPQRSSLPSANVVGLYRVYGKVIGVSERRIRDLIGDEPVDEPAFRLIELPKWRSMIVLSNLGTRLLVGFLLLTVAAYALWQVVGLVSAPSIAVDTPEQQHIVVHDPIYVISGSSRPETTVLINGQPVPLDSESKRFTQPVYLFEGYNRVRVEATNSFSRVARQDFTVTFVPRD